MFRLISTERFRHNNKFDIDAILEFSEQIDRDPGIVLGRLENDGFVEFNDRSLQRLRHKYKVKISC